MKHSSEHQVEEKTLAPTLIAGVRMKGAYADCAKGFAKLGKGFGRHICGPALLLHYDSEYKETDADFEACMPIRQGESKTDMEVRTLPGGRCISLLHAGPYEELGKSYAKIQAYLTENGHASLMPTREIYIKGPGMIFKGNPKKYLTEIQFLIDK